MPIPDRPASPPIVDLVLRAQRGDALAFSMLATELQDMAVGFAFARLGDRQLAEDVAQDALLDVYRLLPSLREPAALIAWLRRILIKHCDRVTRRHDWSMTIAAEVPPDVADPEPGALDRLLLDERDRAVQAMIRVLPTHLRTVVVLYYFGDRSISQISAFLDIAGGTVKSRLSAARSILRQLAHQPFEDAVSANRPSTRDDFLERLRLALVAAADGESAVLSALLADDASLATTPGPHPFWGGQPNALQVAAEWGRTESVRRLLDAGVDPDCQPSAGGYDGWSALLLALAKGHRDTAALLMSYGATLDIYCASLLGDVDRVEALLAEDPSRAVMRGVGGATPLHYAATSDVAQLLVARGADVTATDDAGWTPLEATAFSGAARRDAARWLLDRAGALNLAVAAALDDPALIAAVLVREPDALTRRSDSTDGATHSPGASALHIGAALGAAKSVGALLAAGADPNAASALGHAPLHMAAKSGSHAVAELLIGAGADASRLDGEHQATAADWAEFFGHPTLRDWLRTA